MTMNKSEWLSKRKGGIGGSDAAAIIGKNPWLSNVELWELKTGRKEKPDISDNSAVKYGIAAEPLLIDLFRLDYPEYKVEHKDFNILHDPEYDFLIANLDAEIETADGKKGVLEIKTAAASSSAGWEKWNNRVPDNYYCQILHYLMVTKADFAILKAQIKNGLSDPLKIETRHYYWNAADVKDDIEYLRAAEIKFWQENVLKDVRPDLILPEI